MPWIERQRGKPKPPPSRSFLFSGYLIFQFLRILSGNSGSEITYDCLVKNIGEFQYRSASVYPLKSDGGLYIGIVFRSNDLLAHRVECGTNAEHPCIDDANNMPLAAEKWCAREAFPYRGLKQYRVEGWMAWADSALGLYRNSSNEHKHVRNPNETRNNCDLIPYIDFIKRRHGDVRQICAIDFQNCDVFFQGPCNRSGRNRARNASSKDINSLVVGGVSRLLCRNNVVCCDHETVLRDKKAVAAKLSICADENNRISIGQKDLLWSKGLGAYRLGDESTKQDEHKNLHHEIFSYTRDNMPTMFVRTGDEMSTISFVGYGEGMKSNPKTTTEYTAFEKLLRRVVKVPHSEIKAKLDAEKRAKKQKHPKTSDASRVSHDKD